ncbi:hypothetical protein M8C21_007541 [Ambrosia artemisiifolia]|uniref:non-specific serine/threonine protein kinase n=1 Tax=Ambrosia artemisiifolia TaxID=4212 RepID=A0AAD5CBA5_AMBAR|nr:hypothetical protein M8C21_007541 [Ambrosia artemisiifolia]
MSCSCFGSSRLRKKETSTHRELEGYSLDNIRNFSYKELQQATYNFDRSTKIGRGGFGIVYKGVLKDGTQVAVKTLCAESKQGGLAYLHEELKPHIVHRDIKASNILLDKDFTPKIGDFGLAKLFPDSITHISTKLAGTTGYLAPEYVLGGQLTLKADVYSFGVLVLETISGKSSSLSSWGTTQKVLLEWAWELYQEGRLIELVDHDLKTYPKDEVIKYIKVAFFCTQATANRRPTMSQVVEMLSRNVKLNEKELTPPGFFQDSSENKKASDASTSRQISSFPTTITELTPR